MTIEAQLSTIADTLARIEKMLADTRLQPAPESVRAVSPPAPEPVQSAAPVPAATEQLPLGIAKATLGDIDEATLDFARKNYDGAKALLKEFGAVQTKDLKPDQYPAYLLAARQALAALKAA